MKNIRNYYLWCLVILALSSCESFLDEKPEKSILVPNTVEDVRALLDYYPRLNENALIDFIVADDWETDDINWSWLNPWEQNAYLWKERIFDATERSTDYTNLQRKIYTANVALQVLENIDSDEEVLQLEGEARFVRGMTLFQLATLFLPHPSQGNEGIIIPVKLSPDINQSPLWWSISDVLHQVEADLLNGFELMDLSSQFKNRPNKAVAKAGLARLYLYSERWSDAEEAVNYILAQDGYDLIDYHEMNSEAAYPFTLFNSEVLYYGVTSSFSVTASSSTFINPDLMDKYGEGDLRKTLYFTGDSDLGYLYRGAYNGDYNLFTGISLSEVYLIGAEVLTRLNRNQEALELLEKLAENRYETLENWESILVKDPLEMILEERQKELVFRGTRWMDMKRLSALGELEEIPVRMMEGQSYSLPQKDLMYLELPTYEFELEEN